MSMNVAWQFAFSAYTACHHELCSGFKDLTLIHIEATILHVLAKVTILTN